MSLAKHPPTGKPAAPLQQQVAPQDVGLCPQRTQHLLDVLQAEVDCQRLPGAVVVIARHGQLALFESVGALDPATGLAMPRDAIFRIYSMTKPIVSVAALMLMEQGRPPNSVTCFATCRAITNVSASIRWLRSASST